MTAYGCLEIEDCMDVNSYTAQDMVRTRNHFLLPIIGKTPNLT